VQRRSLSLICVGLDPDGSLQILRRPSSIKMAARELSQVVPPRTVTLSGGGSAIWVLEVRTLGLSANTSLQLHANLDGRARGMRSVAEWAMTTYALPEREETVVQLVIRRRTAALRPDNVFLAWSRVVSNLFKHATLARRMWQEFLTPSGGSKYHLYCDVRSASGLFPAVCRSVAESAGGGKVLAYSTDALPLLPRGLRKPAVA
jgi:hypothetical protein